MGRGNARICHPMHSVSFIGYIILPIGMSISLYIRVLSLNLNDLVRSREVTNRLVDSLLTLR